LLLSASSRPASTTASLYTGDGIGVPWNGLTSVNETPTGGDPKPAYIDGRKFRNIASSEEFKATIEAFAAPKEFGPCDGSRSIQNGLIATQQPSPGLQLQLPNSNRKPHRGG
jgi:hypothetical protein